jgi:hypothetical protein
MYVRMKFKVKYTFEDRRTPWPTRLRETSPQEPRRCWRCHTHYQIRELCLLHWDQVDIAHASALMQSTYPGVRKRLHTCG